jgi:uncharacterized Zn finger protein (UPF0148 family)
VVTCKQCGNPLVTTLLGSNCVVCGRRASVLRASRGDVRMGRKRAIKRVIKVNEKQSQKLIEQLHRGDPPAVAAVGANTGRPQLTWQQAELLTRDWMRKNGYRDAHLTGSGSDGGVDVTSAKAVAQVKYHAKPVGLGEMQRIYGIAQSTRKKALFFSSAGYTPKALQWARGHGIETYRFPPVARVK